MNIKETMLDIGKRAKVASIELATISAERKHAALIGASEAVWKNRATILEANALDMGAAKAKGLSAAMLDRLMLDEDRLRSVIDGLRAVAEQKDPIGEVIADWDVASGLNIKRVRTPLGVIGVIYESRPNVTVDAGALCLKSGNAVILRGGSESFHSSAALHKCLVKGLISANVTPDAIQLVPTVDRDAVGEMLAMTAYIDVIVPRGGKGLVGRVQADARVPVFAHLEGICHIYIDANADVEKARKIIVNAKTRRTGICGAVECLLIDRRFYEKHGAPFVQDLLELDVDVRGDDALQTIAGVSIAQDSDWGCEYLDKIVAARIVGGIDDAIKHIRTYGSNHTDCIVTENADSVAQFFNELDSAILIHNASTQFADGSEFGMGAEIGIATGKMHARGPVGAEQLTSFKYLVVGDGTIRA